MKRDQAVDFLQACVPNFYKGRANKLNSHECARRPVHMRVVGLTDDVEELQRRLAAGEQRENVMQERLQNLEELVERALNSKA